MKRLLYQLSYKAEVVGKERIELPTSEGTGFTVRC